MELPLKKITMVKRGFVSSSEVCSSRWPIFEAYPLWVAATFSPSDFCNLPNCFFEIPRNVCLRPRNSSPLSWRQHAISMAWLEEKDSICGSHFSWQTRLSVSCSNWFSFEHVTKMILKAMNFVEGYSWRTEWCVRERQPQNCWSVKVGAEAGWGVMTLSMAPESKV